MGPLVCQILPAACPVWDRKPAVTQTMAGQGSEAALQDCKMPSSLLSSLLFLPCPSSLFSVAILLFPSTLLASFPPFHRPFMRHLLSVVTLAFTDMQMLRSSHLVLLPGLRSRQSSGYEVVLYHYVYKGGRSEVTYMLRRMAKGVEASC